MFEAMYSSTIFVSVLKIENEIVLCVVSRKTKRKHTNDQFIIVKYKEKGKGHEIKEGMGPSFAFWDSICFLILSFPVQGRLLQSEKIETLGVRQKL